MILIKLNCRNEDLQPYFAAVNHQTFHKALPRNWNMQTVDETQYVSLSSFCWLYCWAKTGLTSPSAKVSSEAAFDAAFSFPFASVDKDELHKLARIGRYTALTAEEENAICQYLPQSVITRIPPAA